MPNAQRRDQHQVHAVGLLRRTPGPPSTATAAAPLASPPSVSARSTRARPRALVCPFSAPMSACRHSGEFAASGRGHRPGEAVLYSGDCGSSAEKSMSIGGGGTTGAIRSQSDSRGPIWKSAPSGPAISSPTNFLNVLFVIRRITSPTRWPWLFAWYPDAVPGSHHGRCCASRSVDVSQSYMSRDRERRVPAGDAGGVRQQVPHQDVLLALGRELRPVVAHRRVDVQVAALDQHQRREAEHASSSSTTR